MVKIYLVRHAEAEGNVKEFFQGRIDTEVSQKGRLQLDRLAERFRDIPIEAIYSSPLRRAFTTAEAVNRYHGLPIITDSELMEINGGDWEGVKWAELPQKFPAELRLWKEEINNFTAPNGESTKQVYDRMKAAMKHIASENQGRTIAVISHGMAIKAYLNCAEGREWENYSDPGWADNTAVSLIEYSDGLVPRIIFKNDDSHLDNGLSTLAVSKWCSDELEVKA
ncbi:MAG: histidine phosphatase family protein [Oscillospiraceae bacterium]|nr:histidine phosphatase family protein [Oscillospiraceae bacterium]